MVGEPTLMTINCRRYHEDKIPFDALVSILKESFVKEAPSSRSHCAHAPSSVKANSVSMNLIGKLGRYLPNTNIEHRRKNRILILDSKKWFLEENKFVWN